jgi:hypothetical protein
MNGAPASHFNSGARTSTISFSYNGWTVYEPCNALLVEGWLPVSYWVDALVRTPVLQQPAIPPAGYCLFAPTSPCLLFTHVCLCLLYS